MTDKKSRAGRPKGQAIVEERRMRVKNYLSMGFTKSNIARVMEISRNTVQKDIEYLESLDRQQATGLDKFKEVGAAISFYKEIEELAKKELKLGKNMQPKDKLDWVKTAMVAQEKRIALSMEVGLIPRGESTSPAAVEYEQLMNASAEELRVKKNALLKELGHELTLETKKDGKRQKENKYKEEAKKLEEGIPAKPEDNETDFYFNTVPFGDTEEPIEVALKVFSPDEIKKIAGSAGTEIEEKKNEEKLDNSSDDAIIT